MRFVSISTLTVCVLLLVRAPYVEADVDHMPWSRDLTDAQRLAAQRNQLVLIHFWSPDCAPCQAIERNVFSSARFGAWVASRYVPVKLNVKEFASVAYEYRVNSWPMDVITTPDGRVVHTMASPPDERSYVAVLGQVAAGPPAHTSQRDQARSSESGPAPAGVEGGSASYSSMGNGQYVSPLPWSQQGGGGNYYLQPSESQRPSDQLAQSPSPYVRPDDAYWDRSYSQPPQESQGEVRHQLPTAAEIHNQYASRAYRQPSTQEHHSETRVDPREAPGVSDRSLDRSSYGPQHIAAGIAPADDAQNDRQDNASSSPRQYVENDRNRGNFPTRPNERIAANGLEQRTGSWPPSATLAGDAGRNERDWQAERGTYAEPPATGPPSDPALAHGPASYDRPSRQAPPRVPLPLGLEGYCPVTLVDQSKWFKADPRWGIVHRGRTYLFSSAEAKERFWANPDRYSPALSGLDTVMLADQGDHMEGSRNHGLVYRERVYLFSSEQSLQQFVRSPQRYADYVHQATAAADGRNEWR